MDQEASGPVKTGRSLLKGLSLEVPYMGQVNYMVPSEKLPLNLPPWLIPVKHKENPSHTFLTVLIIRVKSHPWLIWPSFIQHIYAVTVWDKVNYSYGLWLIKNYMNSLYYVYPRMLGLPVGIKQMSAIKDRYILKWSHELVREQKITGSSIIRNTGILPEHYGGFKNFEEQESILVNPSAVYYLKNDGRIGHFLISLTGYEYYEGRVDEALFPWIENNLGNASNGTEVHSCFWIQDLQVTMTWPKKRPFLNP